MTRALLVFGDQTASEIVNAADEAYCDNFDVIRKFLYTDRLEHDAQFCDFVNSQTTISYILGMIDVKLKPKVESFAQQKGFAPFSVIHPTAYVAPSATIGDGTFVAPQAVVSVNAKIGCHSIIHIHSSIGHDCQIGDYCAVLPGARISGNVVLDDGVMIGSGAFVYQGVKIGCRAHVDALTYVRNDVEAKRTVSCRSQQGQADK